MPSKTPNILYSATSSLAYRINQEFYNDLHYVWCSTKFGSPGVGELFGNPTSSRPYERFIQMKADTGSSPDRHSDIISNQRAGLKRGAQIKFDKKVISRSDRNEIFEIVDQADIADFKPLMYLIPFARVAKLAKRVPVAKRAHPFSDEWIIEKLPGQFSDIIRF